MIAQRPLDLSPQPRLWSADEVYAVTAYVLHLDGIVPADAVLDATTLPAVVMPNRDGYTREHGLGSVDGTPDVANSACMRACADAVTITSELPAGFVEHMYGDVWGAVPMPPQAAIGEADLGTVVRWILAHGAAP